jgi:hypothetical protein
MVWSQILQVICTVHDTPSSTAPIDLIDTPRSTFDRHEKTKFLAAYFHTTQHIYISLHPSTAMLWVQTGET